VTFFRLSLFPFAALALVLSACAAPEKTPLEQEPVAKTVAKPAKSANDELANLPPIDMQPPERALREGLQGPQGPEPERLIGLAAADIQKMFGLPDFRRRDPPAEIWQYRKDGCMLDFFLYQVKEGSIEYRVTHVEARGRSVEEVSGTECLLEALAR
jgi:hypothetical protein